MLLTSCDDFLDIQPTGKVIAKTCEEYRALLTDVYNNFPDDRALTPLRSAERRLDPAIARAGGLAREMFRRGPAPRTLHLAWFAVGLPFVGWFRFAPFAPPRGAPSSPALFFLLLFI